MGVPIRQAEEPMTEQYSKELEAIGRKCEVICNTLGSMHTGRSEHLEQSKMVFYNSASYIKERVLTSDAGGGAKLQHVHGICHVLCFSNPAMITQRWTVEEEFAWECVLEYVRDIRRLCSHVQGLPHAAFLQSLM